MLPLCSCLKTFWHSSQQTALADPWLANLVRDANDCFRSSCQVSSLLLWLWLDFFSGLCESNTFTAKEMSLSSKLFREPTLLGFLYFITCELVVIKIKTREKEIMSWNDICFPLIKGGVKGSLIILNFELPIRDSPSLSDISYWLNQWWCYFIWDRAAHLMPSTHWRWALCILRTEPMACYVNVSGCESEPSSKSLERERKAALFWGKKKWWFAALSLTGYWPCLVKLKEKSLGKRPWQMLSDTEAAVVLFMPWQLVRLDLSVTFQSNEKVRSGECHRCLEMTVLHSACG